MLVPFPCPLRSVSSVRVDFTAMVSRSHHSSRDRRNPSELSHMCLPYSRPLHLSVLHTFSLFHHRLYFTAAVPLSPCSSVLCWRSRHFLLDAPSRSLAVTDAGDGFVDSGGDLSSWTTPGPLGGDPPGLSVTRVRLKTCGIGELFLGAGRPVNCETWRKNRTGGRLGVHTYVDVVHDTGTACNSGTYCIPGIQQYVQ